MTMEFLQIYLTKPGKDTRGEMTSNYLHEQCCSYIKMISNLINQQIIIIFDQKSEFIKKNSRMVQIVTLIMEVYYINSMKEKGYVINRCTKGT